jgi:hypothetical protein
MRWPLPVFCEKRKTIKNKTTTEKKGRFNTWCQLLLSADGKPITSEEFMNNLFEHSWFQKRGRTASDLSNPMTRKTLLEADQAGFWKGRIISSETYWRWKKRFVWRSGIRIQQWN